MKKKNRNILIYFILIFTFIFLFSSIIHPVNAMDDIHIVLDSNNSTTLPQNFRKTTDIKNLSSLKSINLTGLDKLNISGSAQFTEFNLPLIVKAIDENYFIIDIDLREESHGFVNGIAVSFKNSNNNSNKGLSLREVIDKESADLASIKLNTPLTLYDTNITLTPNIVENESKLVKSNKLDYLRIPVTDGELPNEDMVNYFVDFVKKQPQNSWLHFHCKAGIGRTTTFMIMYDIMKNCNEVSLQDIIARQVLLSDISKKDSIDFFIGKRYEFLNKFYNKCKNDEFKLSSTNTKNSDPSYCCVFNTFKDNYSDIPLNIEDNYMKNARTPKFLYAICENDMSTAERTMIATLQGLLASKSDNQIYILSSNEPDYKLWLRDLNKNYNIKYELIKDPWVLIEKFKKYVDGYVIFSTVKKPSINNACTLASLKNAIAIDESIEDKLKSYGIVNLIRDCRDTDERWAFDTLWNNGLNHSTVIELSTDKWIPLRDYAVLTKSLIFYEDDIKDTSFRETVFSSIDAGGRVLGWGPDEHTNVQICSKNGVDMIPADWSYNLSVLSAFKSAPQVQHINNYINNEDGYHYVTFVMSDGDNQQWLLGSNYSMKNWFGSPYRGKFSLGWSLSRSLYYLAPTVFNKYYESASKVDNFLVSASGNGYMYPSKYPYDDLDEYTKRLNNYMAKVDQHHVLILDDESFYKKEIWDKYTLNSNIDSLLYLNYDINNAYKGKIIWSNDKPVISCRDLLWGGLEDENQLVDNINERVNLGYTDIKDPNSYTFVYVHVWSNTMDNVNDVINKLDKNPKVKIVTPDTFVKLVQRNVTRIES